MNQFDVKRFHNAAKMIENDLTEAYYSCRMKYGSDVAGVLLVSILRNNFNPKDKWPVDDSLEEKVNQFLIEKGILNL